MCSSSPRLVPPDGPRLLFPRPRPLSRAQRRRRGNTAIEFALCMPLWVALVFAIMDYGWLFFQASSLNAATNLGCRAGSLVDPGPYDEDIDQVEAVAAARMEANLVTIEGQPCIECGVDAHTVGEPPQRTLVCTATRQLDPIVGIFIHSQQMTATQTARLEWQRSPAE